MSSLALRGAIYQYLQSEHPSVARKMKAKILLENDDSDEDEVELCNAKSAIVKKYGPKATFSTVLEAEYKSLVPEAGTRRSRSASAPPKSSSRAASTSATTATATTKTKKSPLVAPVATATKKAAAAAADSSDSDSDSSDAIVPPRRVVINKVLPKKVSPKLSPVVAPVAVATKKKIVAAAADSSDSDSDDVPPPKKTVQKRSVSKPKSVSPALKPVAVAKKTSTKTAVALSSSSDDDDAQPMKVVNNKQQEQQQNYDQEEGQQEEEQYVKKQSYANSKFDNINLVHPSYRSQKGMGGAADKEKFGDRFCRIDLEGVKYRDDRLRDNMPGQEATGFLQNRKMMAVRGKEFNKHKQKNKAKLYAAGVDQSIRSVKFENWSDSD